MKKIIILGFAVITAILFATQMIVHLENGDTVPFNIDDIESITFGNGLFFDDFESDTIGQLPSNWEVQYSGDEIIIDYDPINTNNQVLKLLGASNWVASVYRPVEELPDGDRIVEADMYVTSNNETGVDIGSFEFNGAYIAFRAIDENTITARFSDGSQAGSFPSNEWLHLKMVVDWDNSSYEAYIDDVLYYTGDFTPNTEQPWHYDIYLGTSNQSNSTRLVYFDNVFEQNTDITIYP